MSIFHTPIPFGSLQLPNRLVMPPVATYLADGSGEVTDASCAHYGKLSAGGYIGLVVTEHSYVSPEGKAREGQLSTADDRTVAGLARLADAIHRSGCKVMAQISHAGGVAHPAAAGAEIVSASAVPMPQANGSGPLPRELATDEIARIVGDFANAAARVKQAGYDAVEIHAAHGYLLSQFYSPLTNRRADAYTGSTLDGRIRLHLAAPSGMRSAKHSRLQSGWARATTAKAAQRSKTASPPQRRSKRRGST